MKHTWKITVILLGMFLITQLIGLAVIYSYTYIPELPYGMEPPEDVDPLSGLISTIIAFIIAISLVFLLNKYRAKFILRAWFFVVVVIALGITFYSIFFYIPELRNYATLVSVLVAIPLAYFKILKHNLIVHNLTELFIYPGIAAVFVSFFYFAGSPLMSVFVVVFLLILISVYDIWAVNHSGIMQKMAKFQINELKLFAGFFVPYMDKKQRDKVREIKQKYKDKSSQENAVKEKKIKVSLAILGGGDVIFPIIAAGVFMKVLGIIPALFITAGAALSLLFLFSTAKKGKFYPAMPFLTGGIFIGMILGLLFYLI